MKLYIKYMVSRRCIMKVKEELDKLGIPHSLIELGVVDISGKITQDQLNHLKGNLLRSGLEVIDDKNTILVERIKNTIIEMIHYSDELPKVNYSNHLSEKLGLEYTYLSNLFAEVKGITIQQYIIINRIERVKELLIYDELNLSEISYKLHYSSVAHLSNQFKKVTGITPSFFMQLKLKPREKLENL